MRISICFAAGVIALSSARVLAADGLAQDSNGWTVFTPSPDTRIIYVSSSAGNDATAQYYAPTNGVIGADPFNPTGAVRAYQTASAAGAQMRIGCPDWLLFRRGDAWYATLTATSGRSPSERSLIAAYGADIARPLFKTASNSAVNVSGRGFTNIALVSLSFNAHTRDPWSGEYVNSNGTVGINAVTMATNAVQNHFLIEDCRFSFYQLGLSFQCYGTVTDVVVRRSQILDSYSVNSHSQGFYAHLYRLLLEDCVFDHNGWLIQGSGSNDQMYGGATMFNHNTYFSDCDDCIFRGNIFLRSSSMQNKWTSNYPDVDPVQNLTMADNLYADGEIGIGIGGNVIGTDRWINIAIVSNVMTDIGLSQPTARTLAWYLDIQDWSNGIVAGNILTHQTNALVNNVYGMHTGGSTLKDVDLRDNLVWNLRWGNAVVPSLTAGLSNVRWLRNKLQADDPSMAIMDSPAVAPGYTYASNVYFTTKLSSQWFRVASVYRSFDTWTNIAPEAGAISRRLAFADPDRTLERYNVLQGGAPAYTDFIARARSQSKRTWNPAYTAQAINQYFRDGFIVTSGAPLFAAVLINDGAVTAANNEVTLALSAQDPLPATMQISEASDFSGATWQAYTTRWQFALSPMPGLKTVYARFAHGGVNVSDTASASIVLMPEPLATPVAVTLAIMVCNRRRMKPQHV